MGKLARIVKSDSKGLTLVEILVVIALLSIIITLSMSVFMSGKNTVDRQNTKAAMQDSVTLAMKDITKQVRSVAPDDVIIENNNNFKVGAHRYRLSDEKIFKDNILLVERIGELTVEKEANLVSIRITSTDSEVSLFTEIRIRE